MLRSYGLVMNHCYQGRVLTLYRRSDEGQIYQVSDEGALIRPNGSSSEVVAVSEKKGDKG